MANYLEIVFGVGGNRIDPLGKATVEQSILMINRLYQGFSNFKSGANKALIAYLQPVLFTVSEGIPLFIHGSQLASDPDGDNLTIFSLIPSLPMAPLRSWKMGAADIFQMILIWMKAFSFMLLRMMARTPPGFVCK